MENNKMIDDLTTTRRLSQPLTLVVAFVIVALVVATVMFGVFVYLK